MTMLRAIHLQDILALPSSCQIIDQTPESHSGLETEICSSIFNGTINTKQASRYC